MSRGIDLELLRGIFQDDATHIALAKVNRVQTQDDMSAVYVTCTLVPEGRQVLATMGWDSVGHGSGSGDLPELDDLVLVCFAEREVEHAYVIKRITSAEEPLPLQMKDGHFVTKAKPGKKLILGSDTKTEIGRANAACTEPLVLGAVLMTMLGTYIDKIVGALTAIKTGPIGLGNLGAPVPTDVALATTLTQTISDLNTLKSTFITTADTNIVSQAAFTERGT